MLFFRNYTLQVLKSKQTIPETQLKIIFELSTFYLKSPILNILQGGQEQIIAGPTLLQAGGGSLGNLGPLDKDLVVVGRLNGGQSHKN